MRSVYLRLPAGNKPVRSGFTLLEVLLTSLLASVVLIALWSLSDIYLKMFATGRKKIEETQLARGLTAQLAKDVSQVIQLADQESNPYPGLNSLQHDSDQPVVPDSAESRRPRFGRPGASQPGEAQGRGPNSQRPGSRSPNSPELGREGFASGARAVGPPASNPQTRGPTQKRGGTSTSSLDRTGQNDATLNGFASTSQGVSVGSRTETTLDMGRDLPQTERMIPKFGLFGTSRSLRLVVLQADPQHNRAPTELADVLPLPGQPRAPLAVELRTIQYTFALPTDSTPNEAQHPSGLVRREWAWETWSGRQSASLTEVSSPSSTSDLPEWNSEDALAFELGQDVFHIPQVTGLEFRYYDGLGWEFEWDSEERNDLPVLVEVLFKIRTTGESAGTTSTESEEMESEAAASSSDDGTSSSWSAGAGVVYRQLIHLPFAETHAVQENVEQMPPVPEMAGSAAVASPARNRQR